MKTFKLNKSVSICFGINNNLNCLNRFKSFLLRCKYLSIRRRIKLNVPTVQKNNLLLWKIFLIHYLNLIKEWRKLWSSNHTHAVPCTHSCIKFERRIEGSNCCVFDCNIIFHENLINLVKKQELNKAKCLWSWLTPLKEQKKNFKNTNFN